MSEMKSTEQIWRLLSGKLRSFILARVSDEHAAEDLLQELFLGIHQNIGALRDDQRLSPWVYQIARNVIADHYRSRVRLEPGSIESIAEAVPGANVNSDIAEWLPQAIGKRPTGRCVG